MFYIENKGVRAIIILKTTDYMCTCLVSHNMIIKAHINKYHLGAG